MRRLLLVLIALAGVTVLARGAVPCSAWSLQAACYVGFLPGPVENSLELVDIEGDRAYASAGELLLTTIQVEADLDLNEWFRYIVSPRVATVPRERVFPPGEEREETEARFAALMDSSQLDATIAGLRAVGQTVDEEPDGARVEGIADPSSVDDGQLQVGDVIVGIDGAPIATNEEVIDLVHGRAVGDELVLDVRRDGAFVEERVTLIEAPDEPGEPRLGVLLSTHLELPIDVRIDAGAIGGPSAGLMFALGIVDTLGPEDLTGGAIIAGTGTIDRDGNVGAIGGIAQKLVGATARSGDARPAAVFLVPAGNLDEARTAYVPRDITLIPVAHIDEAIAALEDLRAGRTPPGATVLAAS